MNEGTAIVEFDKSRRILHISYRKLVHPRTKRQLERMFSSFTTICDRYFATGRFYLIIDMSNLIIEPDLAGIYAQNAGDTIGKYIFPRGVARYGHQITRLTVRQAYAEYMADDPQIFASREEAFAYINELIVMESTGPIERISAGHKKPQHTPAQ